MTKKSNLPLFRLLPLFVLGLLLLTGIAYGLWSETLRVEGVVHTGEVYGEWTSCICNDDGLDPLPTPWPYAYPRPIRKDVGSTTCVIDEKDPRILRLTITNGYPSYWGNCEVHFANTGSVPVIIRGYRVIPHNFTLATSNGAENGEIWVRYWDGVGAQMEPCDHDTCEQASSLQFHVEQPAKENHTYRFSVQVCLGQWNEAATLDQCLEAAPQY
ncbi:MAG: hypothetical protein AB1453_15045 [Chloroflexota bacterium]|jgi:hypothetical protein